MSASVTSSFSLSSTRPTAGRRPVQCPHDGCGRSFSRKSHLRRHSLQHTGTKKFKCTFVSCKETFFDADKLKKHTLFSHGDKKHFKCTQPNCTAVFKKRRAYKLHLAEHGVPSVFKCSKDGCSSSFSSPGARKAHEKKHTATYTCQACQKVFKWPDALRKHMRVHALHKPVLVCPKTGCQAYFSTTFNLQHHLRKVHLQVLKYGCPFADCPRTFAMRRRQRSRKEWQQRLDGHRQHPLVEDDLRRLFSTRMRISRRAKLEADLSGLFNERKIPRYVDPEVNLCSLFSLKAPRVNVVPVAIEVPPVT
ncbi:hypothetical protein CRUP_004065 [Coryphaenoides rupestris]|nr:hypothetical protein CRUP_004065 [Coryphaenoides rupestris]